MDGKTVVILGGGWGGLAAAHDLRGLLPPEHRVVVVEPSATFSLCMSYLWLVTGERAHPSDARREMAKLAREGIEWVHDRVERIDPVGKMVELTSGSLHADHLVIALGAEIDRTAIPGLAASAYNLYDAEDAVRLRDAVARFESGRIVFVVARTPYRCPAAPYEAAFLVEAALEAAGTRERADIAFYTPEKAPMPVAGPAVGQAISEMLAGRGIGYHPEHAVSAVDGASGTAVFDDRRAPFDLLVAVPPHRAPRVVVDAALTDATGYIPVHPQTLEILSDPDTLRTRHPGVYAIGDVTSIRLMNGMLLPKAGVFVEAEARVVAENIAAAVRGSPSRARFDGRGFCYLEVGNGLAAYSSGDFYAYPAPNVALTPPSPEHKRAKQEFERVLESWFVA